MKTATIRVYQIFGTHDWCADVMYRGRRVRRFTREHVLCWASQSQGVLNAARAWAYGEGGFTHYKVAHG